MDRDVSCRKDVMQTGIEKRLLCIVAAVGLTACATAPTHQMGESQATLRAAEAVGAQEHPRAAYHLKLAQEQIASAKPLMDGDRSDVRDAERLLLRAEVDAQLAMQLARTEDVQAEAKHAWAEVRELQNGGNAP
jgi:hypothetical protein